MKNYFLKEKDFLPFLERLLREKNVYAPVSKKHKFVFGRPEKAEDIRLDYDVTLLPPKKLFFPVKQNLVAFSKNGYDSCINPEEQLLLGVHSYDLKAIAMLDHLFRENFEDRNYLARREKTTIVGCNSQKISDRAFWKNNEIEKIPEGQDGFITRLSTGYLYEVFTEKGEQLLVMGNFRKAAENEKKEAAMIIEEGCKKVQEKCSFDSSEVAEKTRSFFNKNLLWENLSEKCFSCGTCNIVCPTCYCFDVQDVWNLDQVSGLRFRTWDACLTEDFSKASLGGGASENFREERSERYRHRIMRKLTYLNEKLGSPACVGCGRCSSQCVPDIADPLNFIKTILEGRNE